MKQIELIEKRKPREKHFLQEDGTIVANIYDEDIHYLKNGKYEEIDNTLEREGNYIANKSNSFKAMFNIEKPEELLELRKDNHFINIKLKSQKTSLKGMFKKFNNKIVYDNILNNISMEYKVLSSKVKESIIINDKSNIPETILFYLDTDLDLTLNKDKTIFACKDDVIIFTIEAPYMEDANGNVNNNIYYKLNYEKGEYSLTLVLDTIWLNDEKTIYPVIIDPTITTETTDNNIYDTYIYPGDTNVVRYNQAILKAGVERINGVDRTNRTLLKFDLPDIGTASQIIDASVRLISYPTTDTTEEREIITMHRITSDWSESSANWNMMNDKYDNKVEACIGICRSHQNADGTVDPAIANINITNLVKKWYTGTTNYGLMIKQYKEVYHHQYYPAFFSKNNSVSGINPKPLISITYRNQNGVESYMSYQTQRYKNGNVYVNNYNGNLVAVFDIGKTLGSKLLPSLAIVYNTNDLVLGKNFGYGIGYKLNLHQVIKEVNIGGITYLEYTDSDSTLHYFLLDGDVYKDEDNLNLCITKTDTKCEMKDKFNNTYEFIKNGDLYYLNKVTDLSNNNMTITYNTSNQITKICDEYNQEINISYPSNKIVIVDNFETTNLNFAGGNLISIVSDSKEIVFEHTNALINKIIDSGDFSSFGYEYYEQSPFKVKKIIEYGADDAIGNTISYEYGFDSTTMTDNRGRVSTIVFNSRGGTSCITNLNSMSDVKNAYGKHEVVGEDGNSKNKLLSIGMPLKHVNNYIFGSSLEDRDSSEGQNKIFTAQEGIDLLISSDYSYLGDKSLKIVSSQNNAYMDRTIAVPKGNYYTFSAYFKTSCPFKIGIGYMTSEIDYVEETSEIFTESTDFERKAFTCFYPSDAFGDLRIIIYLLNPGTMYMDCVQLEDGEVANYYNLLDNSDFSNDRAGWNFLMGNIDPVEYEQMPSMFEDIFQVVNIGNSTAIKVAMEPTYITGVKKELCVNGSQGDSYNVSFWYKNKGVTKSNLENNNNVFIHFLYDDSSLDENEGLTSTVFLNPNDDNWQYFSYNFVAKANYHGIHLEFDQQLNAGELYITNINIFKDLREGTYEYDDKGNVTVINGLDKKSDKISYNSNNQFMCLVDRNNKSFAFEYDKYKSSLPLREITSDGLIHETDYNENGRAIFTRNRLVGSKNINSGLYYIRLAGTNKYINFVGRNVLHISEKNHDIWELNKSNEGLYSIRHSILLRKYFKDINNLIVLSEDYQDNNIFNIIVNKDFSYYIKLSNTDKYLKIVDNVITLSELDEDDINFKFYFEQTNNKMIIENALEYDQTQRYILKSEDANLNKITYDVDTQTGMNRSIKNAKGRIKEYFFDSNRNLTGIFSNDRNVIIEYNAFNKLKNINIGLMQYKFEYDAFFNVNRIKVGDNITLMQKVYESNNGNLISDKFGTDEIINYEYDNFDRLSKIIKTDDTISYKYNNVGQLAKVITNNSEIDYEYNLEQKISSYIEGDLSIKYQYNNKNIISSRVYKLGNFINTVMSNYNDDDELSSIEFGNNRIDYIYDGLDRLISKRINNSFEIKYDYIHNGNRCTTLLSSLTLNQNKYSYKYDKLGNITHIYNNDELNNKYYYNEYNELVREDDYITNTTIRYKYDDNQNIISQIKFRINTFEVLDRKKYTYNNPNWHDQLSSYNDNLLTYDYIGNLTGIGNDITLDWINGKELHRYTDTNKVVDYYYNGNGIRCKKIVNGVVTNYSIEKSRIVFEKCGNDVINYVYSDLDNLVGFIYNNSQYFYLKNAMNDIIGIIDANGNLQCSYKYDSWGKLIDVTDAYGNSIAYNASNIAFINHFRYRSYYYDDETGFYYLKTRYYNPEWGRFINADTNIIITDDVIGYNMYAYAYNNPIVFVDSDGRKPSLSKIINKGIKKVKEAYNHCRQVVNNIISAFTGGVPNSNTKIYSGMGSATIYERYGTKVTVSTNSVKTYGSPHDVVTITADIQDDFSQKSLTINMNSLQGKNIASISAGTNDIYVKVGPATIGFSIDSLSVYSAVDIEINGDKEDESIVTQVRCEVNAIIIAAFGIVCVVAAANPVTLPSIAANTAQIVYCLQRFFQQLNQAISFA